MKKPGTLIFFCGKMAAGKSIRSRILADEKNAVLLSEDDWLSVLYPGQINSFEDYLKYSALIKPLLKSHVQNIFRTGVNVVMDFPANTVNQRKWFRDLVTESNCANELIYLKLSDEQCLNRLAKRRIEQPERAQFDTESVFNQVAIWFQAPTEAEGFNIL